MSLTTSQFPFERQLDKVGSWPGLLNPVGHLLCVFLVDLAMTYTMTNGQLDNTSLSEKAVDNPRNPWTMR